MVRILPKEKHVKLGIWLVTRTRAWYNSSTVNRGNQGGQLLIRYVDSKCAVFDCVQKRAGSVLCTELVFWLSHLMVFAELSLDLSLLAGKDGE